MSSDGRRSVTVAEIIEKMDAMKDLRGRPKVLILESCRGGQRNNGLEVRQILKFSNFATQNVN